MSESKFNKGNKIQIAGIQLEYVGPARYWGNSVEYYVGNPGYHHCIDKDNNLIFIPDRVMKAATSYRETSFDIRYVTGSYLVYEMKELGNGKLGIHIASAIPDEVTADSMVNGLEEARKKDGWVVGKRTHDGC